MAAPAAAPSDRDLTSIQEARRLAQRAKQVAPLLAEFTRGTPWAARTRLLASKAQLALDLVEHPDPLLKIGSNEIRQAVATFADDISKAASATGEPDFRTNAKQQFNMIRFKLSSMMQESSNRNFLSLGRLSL